MITGWDAPSKSRRGRSIRTVSRPSDLSQEDARADVEQLVDRDVHARRIGSRRPLGVVREQPPARGAGRGRAFSSALGDRSRRRAGGGSSPGPGPSCSRTRARCRLAGDPPAGLEEEEAGQARGCRVRRGSGLIGRPSRTGPGRSRPRATGGRMEAADLVGADGVARAAVGDRLVDPPPDRGDSRHMADQGQRPEERRPAEQGHHGVVTRLDPAVGPDQVHGPQARSLRQAGWIVATSTRRQVDRLDHAVGVARGDERHRGPAPGAGPIVQDPARRVLGSRPATRLRSQRPATEGEVPRDHRQAELGQAQRQADPDVHQDDQPSAPGAGSAGPRPGSG